MAPKVRFAENRASVESVERSASSSSRVSSSGTAPNVQPSRTDRTECSTTSTVSRRLTAASVVTSVKSLYSIFRKGAKQAPFGLTGLTEMTRHTFDFKHDMNVTEQVLARKHIFKQEEKDGADCKFSLNEPCARVVDSLAVLSVLLTSVLSPIIFMWGGSINRTELVPGGIPLIVSDAALDVAFALYLIWQLNVSVLHPLSRLEITSRRQVRRFHLRRLWYWLQACGTITHVYTYVLGLRFPNASLVYTCSKITRISLLISWPDSLWLYKESKKFELFTHFSLLYLFGHWLACFICRYAGYRDLYVQCLRNPDVAKQYETYFESFTFGPGISLYMKAYIEGMCMMTGSIDNPLGEGGAREGHASALLLVAFFAPVGILVVSIIITRVAEEKDLGRALEKRHAERNAFKTRAMEILRIPLGLQRRVFSMHAFQKMSHDKAAIEILLAKDYLSSSLLDCMKLYLYKDSVLSAAYFQNKDPNYIIEIVRGLTDHVFLPGDYVVRRSEVADSMYFVASGTLVVLVHCNTNPELVELSRPVKELHQGDFFGEVALLKDCVRTAWVLAKTYCVLSALKRSAIDAIWKFFPAERESLRAIVLRVAQEDAVRRSKERWHHIRDIHVIARKFFKPKDESTKPGATAKALSDGRKRSTVAGDSFGRTPTLIESLDSMCVEVEECKEIGRDDSDLEEVRLGMDELIKRQSRLETLVSQVLSRCGVEVRTQGARRTKQWRKRGQSRKKVSISRGNVSSSFST
eukprot:TRINITY_DN57282_c0_g1_i1.p1 TRINITY_DN57282_c0_g1~~TRINITY_DN57282_c0_g1_i1.p1  ORF type:complete len:750 (+),score=80.32 TRINITY_DN57282_c0_g1_i1:121-2370(+)